MSKPKGCTNLTAAQRATYVKLIAKQAESELTEREIGTLDHYVKKMERYADPELSSIGQSYLLKRYAFEKYRKRTAAIGLQRASVEKGTAMEAEAIQLLEEINKTAYIRPQESSKNEFLLGKCDAIDPKKEEIVETKVLWSMDTFMGNYKKLPIKIWYQVQGYMDVYNLKRAQVYYVIMNTPVHLLERERARIWQKYLFGEIDREKYEEENERFDLAYTYNTIPAKRRIINFEVDYCAAIFPKVYRRVERGRLWLAEHEKKHMASKKIITLAEEYINFVEATEEDNTEPNP